MSDYSNDRRSKGEVAKGIVMCKRIIAISLVFDVIVLSIFFLGLMNLDLKAGTASLKEGQEKSVAILIALHGILAFSASAAVIRLRKNKRDLKWAPTVRRNIGSSGGYSSPYSERDQLVRDVAYEARYQEWRQHGGDFPNP